MPPFGTAPRKASAWRISGKSRSSPGENPVAHQKRVLGPTLRSTLATTKPGALSGSLLAAGDPTTSASNAPTPESTDRRDTPDIRISKLVYKNASPRPELQITALFQNALGRF